MKTEEIIKILRENKHHSYLLQKEWESAADAERVLGISRFAIAQVLRGHNKTCGGYIWKYNN